MKAFVQRQITEYKFINLVGLKKDVFKMVELIQKKVIKKSNLLSRPNLTKGGGSWRFGQL